jgi:hypothetical protein
MLSCSLILVITAVSALNFVIFLKLPKGLKKTVGRQGKYITNILTAVLWLI